MLNSAHTMVTPSSRRDDLIEEYRSYVVNVVGYLVRSMHLPVNCTDDFIAAGYLGLVEAAERFEYDSGKPFKNFAFLRIRGAIIDSIRECSDLSGKAYRYAKAMKAAEEVGRLVHDDIGKVGTTTSAQRSSTLASIFNYAARGAMAHRLSVVDFKDLLTTEDTPAENAEVVYLANEIKKKLLILIATLPPKERLVIEEYYFNDKSFVDIGQELGQISKSWVSRIHSKALEHLCQGLQEHPPSQAS